MRRLFHLLFASLSCSAVLAQSCFHPNGTRTTSDEKKRCSEDPSSPIYNVCCATERDVPYGGVLIGTNYTIDRCLSNGLCQNKITTEEHPDGLTSYFREECTELDWNKGNCPMFCLDDVGAGNVQMTPCEDGNPNSETWCCGSTKDCCGKAGEIKVAATLGATATLSMSSSSSSTSSSTSSTSSASSTATPTPTPTPSHTPSSSPAPSTSAGLSGGAKAGIGIGAVAGVLAIFGAGYLLARRRKQQGIAAPYGNVHEMEHDNGLYHNTQGYVSSADHGTMKYRMETGPPQEMSAQIPPQELEAHR